MMESMEDFILFSYLFDGNGGATPLQGQEIGKQLESDNLAWVHLDATCSETRGWLEQEIDYLDVSIPDALLEEETQPRVLETDRGMMLILRGVNLNENSDPEDMVSVRMWIDQNRIISMRRRPLKAARDIESRLLQGKGPVDSGSFIAMFIDALLDRMEPALQELDDRTDAVEERVLEDASTRQREDINAVRKEAILFRRYLAPQRDTLQHMRQSELEWIGEGERRSIRESFERMRRIVEDLDAVRERSQIVKDELATILADRLNKNMYILSVIAAIFLPLGFLTGLLGINVGGIPGAEDPQAFYYFCAILTAIVVLQVVVFKKLRWF